jgi:CTP:molybdopterin cytidylyltransferase MocA
MTSAILLAAGESTRMGQPKALLPWGDVTLIEYQVRELRAAGVDDVVVVLGHAAARDVVRGPDAESASCQRRSSCTEAPLPRTIAASASLRLSSPKSAGR